VRGWDFKIIVGRVLGWNVLKSSRFEVSRAGSNFIFRGKGFGHGLGLCQEGAHVMAQRGATFQRILGKYFPGTSVKREDRIAARSSEGERRTLNVKAAEVFAKEREGFTLPSLRNPPRPLRLNISFDDHPSQIWKADLLSAPAHKHSVSAKPSEAPRFFTISSEHFRVTYPAGIDRRDANQVLSTLESARSDFINRANSASIAIGDLPTLEIRLNESTGDFTARTGQPWWAAAATKGNRIELQPAAILKRRGVLLTTLRHELAHVVIDRAGHNRAPRWLEEGFAIYLAGEGPMFARYATKTKLSPDQIEKRLERPGSEQEMRMLYSLSYNQVSYLIQSGTESSVWKKLAGS
jgi:hypothetical protein